MSVKYSDGAKKINMPLIIAGVLFLFNPTVELIDILPDFIGCILIVRGLFYNRDVCEYHNDARRGFLRLMWLSFSHIPAFLLMISIANNYVNEKPVILLFTFVYGIIEAVLLITSMNNLIDGYVYLGERLDGECTFYLPMRKQKTVSNKKKKRIPRRIPVAAMRTVVNVFFVVKAACEIAPELVYLSAQDDYTYGRGSVDIRDYKSYFIIICVVIALVFGIFAYIRMRSYLRGIAADEQFCDSVLAEHKAKMIPGHPIYTYRRYVRTLIIAAVGIAASIDLFFYNVYILPDAICGILIMASALYIFRDTQYRRATALVAAAYSAVSLAVEVYSIYFVDEFGYSSVGREEAADRAFVFLKIGTIAEAVMLTVTFALFAAMLYSVVKKFFLTDNSLNTYSSAKNEIIAHSFRRKLVTVAVMAGLSGASNAANIFFLSNTYATVVESAEYEAAVSYYPVFEGFWFINLVVSVIFAVYAGTVLSSLAGELKRKLDII